MDTHDPAYRPLTREDIDQLLADRSTLTQMEVVSKLAEHYTHDGKGAMSPQQLALADDIFRLLMGRGDTVVRAMVSMHLSLCERLPHELAVMMAKDASNEVAAPMLQYSEVLTDADLTGIITSLADSPKLTAIARRRLVAEPISELLVSTSLEPVVAALVENEGASISAPSYQEIVQRYIHDVAVMEALLQRNHVPLPVIESAISALPPRVKQVLERQHGDLNQIRMKKRSLTRHMEQGTLKMQHFKSNDEELMQLIRTLEKTQKLSPFSALAMCNLQLFEVSLSRLLRVPLKNIHLLLMDETGFSVAYDKAALPPQLRAATGLAVRALRACELEQQSNDIKEPPGVPQVIARMRQLALGQRIEGMDRLFAIMQHQSR